MTNNNTKKTKPRLTHIDKSMKVNGKWTDEHKLVVKTAYEIFNGPSLTKQPARKNKGK
ncbi:MAG: hypothetical protein ACRD8W_03450 [Nitrososphaeraceae archaeon]